MIFKEHSNLKDQHAFLGASKYHWINYDAEKLQSAYLKWLSVQKGTRLHAYAAESINLGIKLPRTKQTLNMYVNDAIGYYMKPEQPLYYSDNCFGTADTIGFRKNMLRIHDLKTGAVPASMHQLEIYMALFCLEYHQDPFKIDAELRIYQNDEILSSVPDPAVITGIMDKIITFDQCIEKIKMGGISYGKSHIT